jgi:hypothetical protein
MKTRSHTRFAAPSTSISSASVRYQPYPKPVSTASRASPSITSPESSFRHLSPTSSIATSIDDIWDSSPTKEGPSSYHYSEASTSATSISSGSRSAQAKNDAREYAQRLMTSAIGFPLESPEEKRPAPLQKRLLMQMVFDEITPYPDQIWMCLISNVLHLYCSFSFSYPFLSHLSKCSHARITGITVESRTGLATRGFQPRGGDAPHPPITR